MSTVEDESVNFIRETTRDLIKHNRRYQRDLQNDSRRCVENISISPATITEIANKLKTKSLISAAELCTLKNGLLEDPKYIELVLNTHGALRGIIRELTGHDVRKQVEAAGCLCNLSLGDARATLCLANSGAYLVSNVDSNARQLLIPVIYALGNISNSPRSTTILMEQGALSKLCEVLTHCCEDVKDAAMYAVGHFCYVLMDDLRQEHLTKILQSLSSPFTITSSQLLFTLSCHRDFNSHLTEKLFKNLLEEFQRSIKEDYCSGSKISKLLYLVRILANLDIITNELYEILSHVVLDNLDDVKLVLSRNGLVSESMFWFLGNLYNFNNSSLLFAELLK